MLDFTIYTGEGTLKGPLDVLKTQLDCVSSNSTSDIWHHLGRLLGTQHNIFVAVYNEIHSKFDIESSLYPGILTEISVIDDSISDAIGTLNAVFNNYPCYVEYEEVQ